jgi:hypothetical protein
MLQRIEDNLSLLSSCSDSSLAAAAGGSAHNASSSSASSASSVNTSGGSGASIPPRRPSASTSPSPSSASASASASTSSGPGPLGGSKGAPVPVGLFGPSTKGEFDQYYAQLSVILLNIALDDMTSLSVFGPAGSMGSNAASSGTSTAAGISGSGAAGSSPGAAGVPVLVRGAEIKNFAVIKFLAELMNTKYAGLNVTVLRVVFALLKAHTPNVVTLEIGGVVSAIVSTLLAIVFTRTIDASVLRSLLSSPDPDPDPRDRDRDANRDSYTDYGRTSSVGGAGGVGGGNDNCDDSWHAGSISSSTTPLAAPSSQRVKSQTSSEMLCFQLSGEYSVPFLGAMLSDILVVLQIVAVSTATRDNSVLALLALVLQHATAPARDCNVTRYRTISGGSIGGVMNDISILRCHNCELETACLQCLNERWVQIIIQLLFVH